MQSVTMFLMHLKKNAMYSIGSFPAAYRGQVMDLIVSMHSETKAYLEDLKDLKDIPWDPIDLKDLKNIIVPMPLEEAMTVVSKPNFNLMKSLGISDDTKSCIVAKQELREQIEAQIGNIISMIEDPSDMSDEISEVSSMMESWRANEYELQDHWGFDRNSNFHREFNIPGCKCPKDDNEILVGSPLRCISNSCIIHRERD